MTNVIVKANNLSKKFGDKYISKNLSFEIPKNTTTFISGENGSGKSVTLKLIAGFLTPTEGNIQREYSKISYTPDKFPSNINLTILEYLKYITNVYNENVETTFNYINLFSLDSQKNLKLKNCSKGTLQKVNIIQALLSKADIYLLDEPLSGLDANTQRLVIDILNRLKGTATIIFTSHEKKFANSICTHILDIKTGFIKSVNSLEYRPNKNFKLIVSKYSADILELLYTFTILTDIKYDSDNIYITLPSSKSDSVIKFLIDNKNHIKEVKDLFENE